MEMFLAWFKDSKLRKSTFKRKDRQNRNLRQRRVNSRSNYDYSGQCWVPKLVDNKIKKSFLKLNFCVCVKFGNYNAQLSTFLVDGQRRIVNSWSQSEI